MTLLRCPACKAQKWTQVDLDNHLPHCSWAKAQWLVAEARFVADEEIRTQQDEMRRVSLAYHRLFHDAAWLLAEAQRKAANWSCPHDEELPR